jgi:hypothetical protein
MSYIRGKESHFKGFGAVEEELSEPLVRLDTCGWAPESGTCKAAQAVVQKALDDQYASAKKQLGGISVSDPAIAAALSGAKDPAGVLARAEELSQKLSGANTEKEAYKLYYAYGRSGLDMLQAYSDFGPKFQELVMAAKSGIETYPELVSWADRVALGKVDGSAIADGLSLASGAAAAVNSILKAFDITNLEPVVSHLNIATGCLKSMVAGSATGGQAGLVGGMVNCGMRMLGRVIEIVGGRKQTPYAHVLAIFVPVDKQKEIIARDAQRLAALLKYHYGVNSYKYIYDKMVSTWPYPSHEFAGTLFNYPGKGGSEPAPGFSIADLAHAAWVTLGGGRIGTQSPEYPHPYLYDWVPLMNF